MGRGKLLLRQNGPPVRGLHPVALLDVIYPSQLFEHDITVSGQNELVDAVCVQKVETRRESLELDFEAIAIMPIEAVISASAPHFGLGLDIIEEQPETRFTSVFVGVSGKAEHVRSRGIKNGRRFHRCRGVLVHSEWWWWWFAFACACAFALVSYRCVPGGNQALHQNLLETSCIQSPRLQKFPKFRYSHFSNVRLREQWNMLVALCGRGLLC